MSKPDSTTQTRRIELDDRAHVPFAVIAVMLLVSSVATIAVLEQRGEPVVDQQAQQVIDRTETAAQSELRTAAVTASHQAGAAPVRSGAGSEIEAIGSAATEEQFQKYTKLLLYLEAVERLPAAGQSIDQSTETTVSLPPVTEDGSGESITPTQAIDNVELTVGYDEPTLEDGIVDVSIQNVEIEGKANGEPLPAETQTVSATFGTPVFELEEKVEEYEAQLNAEFFDDGLPDPTDIDGLSQELALRFYPTAWLKSGWDRFGEHTNRPEDHDFEEVIDTAHAEVLTNHAIFSIQEDVFGTRDPYADRTMRPQYMCMALDLTTTISEVDLETDLNDVVPSENITFTDDLQEHIETVENQSENEEIEEYSIPVNEEVDWEQQLCEQGSPLNDWIFGDEATGDLPEMPPLSELLRDGMDTMEVTDHTIELPVEDFATASYLEYQLDASTDPVTYLEEQADEMEREIEDGGGEVDDDFEDPDVDRGERYDGSPAEIRDELYELDTAFDRSASADSLPRPGTPAGTGWSRDDRTETVRGVSVDSVTIDEDRTGSGYDREIYTITASAAADVEVIDDYSREVEVGNDTVTQYATERERDDVSVDVSGHIESSYEFEAGGFYHTEYRDFRVDPADIEVDYGSHADATFEDGFETALVELTSASSYATAESGIESSLERSLSNADPDELESAATSGVTNRTSATLTSSDVIPAERQAVANSLDNELSTVHEQFTDDWEDDPLELTLNELADDESPPDRVKEHIQTEFEDDLIDDGPYETPEDKANQQLRKAYFDRLYWWLDQFDDEYDDQMGEVDDAIDDQSDGAIGGLNEILDFTQGLANADLDPEPVELEGTPVHDTAHYEVSGSPTYLAASELDRTRDPAIRGPDETVMDTDSDADFDPLSIQTRNRVPWPGLPAAFYWPKFWYATVNSWAIDVKGEYARFEVSSTIGDPSDSDRLTFVAEESPVEVELSDGTTVQAGSNEGVDFEAYTEVFVVMPGAIVQQGGPVPAVSDGLSRLDGTTYCSETWEEVGPLASTDRDNCE